MVRVGVRELKDRLSYYLGLARKGEPITITDRGQEIAMIVPVSRSQAAKRAVELVLGGAATWKGGKPAGTTHAIKGQGRPLSEMVIEDRR